MQSTIEKSADSSVVIKGTIPVSDITPEVSPALLEFTRDIELPGFRRGKVPEARVREEIGEKSLWRAAAERALRGLLPSLLKEHAVIPILPPNILLTISEPDSEVHFTITVIVPPTVTIEDYQKIGAKALEALPAAEQEKDLAEARASLNTQTRSMAGVTEERALTDEESKRIGFENATALSHFLEGEAVRAVESRESQRKRGAVAQALLQKATIHIPAVMIDEETHAMLESTKREVATHLPWSEYLTKRGMDETGITAELRPQAEKRLALDLIFAHIAHKESVQPKEDEVKRVAHILSHQGVPEERAHHYGAEVSIREQIWGLWGLAAPLPPAHDHSNAGSAEPAAVS